MFRSRVSEAIRSIAPSGSKEENTYEITIDEHNHKSLKVSGKTNIYEKIQEDLESTKIENILAAAEMGDESALNKVIGSYEDTTEMPKTLAEAQTMLIKLEKEFAKLPTEIKAEFNNSPEEYIAKYGSKEFEDKIGLTELKEKKAETLKNEKEKIKLEKENITKEKINE